MERGNHKPRRLAVGLLVASAVLAGGWVVGRGYVLARAEAVLAQRGCVAQHLGWAGLELQASELRCPGVDIASAVARPVPRSIRLRGVQVDLAEILPGLGGGETSSEAAAPRLGSLAGLLAVTRVEGLDVRLGERVIAQGLAGSLGPILLEGEGVRFAQTEQGYAIEHQRVLEGPTLRGPLELQASWRVDSGAIEGKLRGRGLSLTHPLLAEAPLTGLDLALDFTGDDGELERPRLEGSASLGGPVARWSAELDAEGLPDLRLELPDSPAGEVLRPLAPVVPELALAEVEGTIGLSAHWRPGRSLTLRPNLAQLEVRGAVEPGLDLDWGAFTYPISDEAGERVPRRSGDGTPGWVPIEGVSLDLVHAVLAAEDSAYHQHEGYHMPAIQEALDADIAEGRVVRGGSTLSQQLAKNLFLDGEQTIARKVRELLLAVELDRSLGKDRVLELYLNVVEFGPGLHGVGPACERYFMKKPDRLALQEAVFVAALLPSPRRAYEQWYLQGRPNRARMAAILKNMVDAGWLGLPAAERAKRAPLSLVPPPQ
jgi:hypothetical protein